MGGAVAAIEAGFYQDEIHEAAFRIQRGDRDRGTHRGGREPVRRRGREARRAPADLRGGDGAGRSSVSASCAPRAIRAAVDAALADVEETARGTGNLLPPMREALRLRATLGEVSDALRARVRRVPAHVLATRLRAVDVAVIGGTGAEGFGLALRLAKAGHHVTIGSRDAERGAESAAKATALAGVAAGGHRQRERGRRGRGRRRRGRHRPVRGPGGDLPLDQGRRRRRRRRPGRHQPARDRRRRPAVAGASPLARLGRRASPGDPRRRPSGRRRLPHDRGRGPPGPRPRDRQRRAPVCGRRGGEGPRRRR